MAATALILTGCAAGTTAPKDTRSASTGTPAPTPTPSITVVYSVASSPGAMVTYVDPMDSSTQQLTTTAAAWSQAYSGTLTNSLGLSLYISVQNGINSLATVTCSITINGSVVDTHSTSGYDIATCQDDYTG